MTSIYGEANMINGRYMIKGKRQKVAAIRKDELVRAIHDFCFWCPWRDGNTCEGYDQSREGSTRPTTNSAKGCEFLKIFKKMEFWFNDKKL